MVRIRILACFGIIEILRETSYRAEVVGVEETFRICSGVADDAADLRPLVFRVEVFNGYVACVENIGYFPCEPPSGNPADGAVAVVDVSGVVGFIDKTGETACDAADMTAAEIEVFVAYLPRVVYVIDYGARFGFFRRIADDSAHIERFFLPAVLIHRSRCFQRAQIVRTGDGPVEHLPDNSADPRISAHVARVV